jgi:hypothetical protein
MLTFPALPLWTYLPDIKSLPEICTNFYQPRDFVYPEWATGLVRRATSELQALQCLQISTTRMIRETIPATTNISRGVDAICAMPQRSRNLIYKNPGFCGPRFVLISLSTPSFAQPLHPRVLRNDLLRRNGCDFDEGKIRWPRHFATIDEEGEQLKRLTADRARQPDFALVAQIVGNPVGPFNFKNCKTLGAGEKVNAFLFHKAPE